MEQEPLLNSLWGAVQSDNENSDQQAPVSLVSSVLFSLAAIKWDCCKIPSGAALWFSCVSGGSCLMYEICCSRGLFWFFLSSFHCKLVSREATSLAVFLPCSLPLTNAENSWIGQTWGSLASVFLKTPLSSRLSLALVHCSGRMGWGQLLGLALSHKYFSCYSLMHLRNVAGSCSIYLPLEQLWSIS